MRLVAGAIPQHAQPPKTVYGLSLILFDMHVGGLMCFQGASQLRVRKIVKNELKTPNIF